MTQTKTKTETSPDTPPEVLARQAKQRPLNAESASLLEIKEYVNDAGSLVDLGGTRNRRNDPAEAARREARARAEEFSGAEPLAGIPEAEVADIKCRNYTGQPQRSATLGDRTPAFVDWLWATQPHDAKVRYAYREIWPTSLPVNWPPNKPEGGLTLEQLTQTKIIMDRSRALASVAPNVRTYTQAEVDEMLAAQAKAKSQPRRPHRRKSPTFNETTQS